MGAHYRYCEFGHFMTLHRAFGIAYFAHEYETEALACEEYVSAGWPDARVI